MNADDSAESGNQAVLTVGCSASVAGLYWNGTEHRSFASEAGSADFAPRNEEEARLALFLAAHVPRVRSPSSCPAPASPWFTIS